MLKIIVKYCVEIKVDRKEKWRQYFGKKERKKERRAKVNKVICLGIM
jgi:hypothetical protein